VEDLHCAAVLSWCTGVDVWATVPTCEVTVKGPNLMRRLGNGGIVELFVEICWICEGGCGCAILHVDCRWVSQCSKGTSTTID
jgi:hypothetical protein